MIRKRVAELGIEVGRPRTRSPVKALFLVAGVHFAAGTVVSPAHAQEATPAPSPSTVTVHIESSRTVQLERQGAGSWSPACTAPCDRELPVDAVYRIGGSGIRHSRPFEIPCSGSGHRYLTVDPVSEGGFVGGILMTSVGGGVMILSLVIGLMVVAIDHGVSCALGPPCPTVDTSNANGFWIATGVGAFVMVIGLAELISNSHTTVVTSPSRLGKVAPAAPWARIANWRDPSPEQRAMPATVGIPVFQTAF